VVNEIARTELRNFKYPTEIGLFGTSCWCTPFPFMELRFTTLKAGKDGLYLGIVGPTNVGEAIC